MLKSQFHHLVLFHVFFSFSGNQNKSELTLTSTVSQTVQDVSFVAQALKAAGVVDARVITGSLKGALINV